MTAPRTGGGGRRWALRPALLLAFLCKGPCAACQPSLYDLARTRHKRPGSPWRNASLFLNPASFSCISATHLAEVTMETPRTRSLLGLHAPARQELQGDVDREANGFPSKTPLTFRESPLVSLPCLQPGNQWWVPGTAPWTFPSLNLLLPAVTLRSLRRQLRSPPCPYHPKDPQPNSTPSPPQRPCLPAPRTPSLSSVPAWLRTR